MLQGWDSSALAALRPFDLSAKLRGTTNACRPNLLTLRSLARDCVYRLMRRPGWTSEKDQPTALLQALSPKPVPVSHVMAPDEAGRPAHARNPICIAVETVVAVRDDLEILIQEADVGNAAGASSTLESQIVVVNGVVARFVFAAVLGPTALVDQHDAAAASGDSQRVVVHLHVLRGGNTNFSAPEPAPVAPAIVPDHIIADRGLE